MFIVILLLLAFVQWYRSRSASTTEESRSGQAAPYDESSVHSMTPSMIEELRSASSTSPSATSAAAPSSRFSLPAPLTRWLGLASPPSDYKQVSGTTTNRLFSIEEEDGKRDEEVEVEL